MPTAVYIILAILGWSSWEVFNKLALNHLPPFAVQFLTAILSIPLAILYWNCIPKDTKWTAPGIAWTVLAALATFGGSLAYMYAASMKQVSAVISLTACYPALTFLIAVLFMNETFTLAKFGGLCLILVGVWFISR